MPTVLLLALVLAASGDELAVKKGCDAGKAADCTQLGIVYLNGRGVKTDRASAAAAFKKACDLRDAGGCTSLGIMHTQGLGMRKDEARGIELLGQGCDGGDPHGCMQRGFALAGGNRVLGLPVAVALLARAADLAGKACDDGQVMASANNVSACSLLGSLYEEGWGVGKDVAHLYRTGKGVPKDVSRAEKVLEHACDAEHEAGCYELGDVAQAYLSGTGAAKDVARAAALFQRACDHGGASACPGLGDLYASGKGVPKDAGRAAAAYKRACDHGFVYDLSGSALQMACDSGSGAACRQLSHLLSRGAKEKGVAKDEAGAARLMERACDAGIAEACSDLGSSYDWRSEESKARAGAFAARGVSLDEKGCAAGEGQACYRLGNAYWFGLAVAKDPTKAAELFKQACNGGSSDGCRSTFEK
jgi:TPR repeat protein